MDKNVQGRKFTKGKVLVIDDEDYIRELLKDYLTKNGYEVLVSSSCEEGLNLLKRNLDVEIVLLDLLFPGENGVELLKKLHRDFPQVMVVVTTAVDDLNTAVECMKLGAFDYLTKPFHLEKIPLVIERAKELKRLKIKEQEFRRSLEERVSFQRRKLRELFLGTLNALVKVLEAKDEYTLGHSRNVASLANAISKAMGLEETLRKKIIIAGHLHDIGKVGVRDDILRKPGPLTEGEFELVKKHPVISVEILSPVLKDTFIIPAVKHHHERMDGKGYPDGLKREEIPLGARILAVADAYEAMTSHRAYRKALPHKIALKEIEKNKGHHFDPEVVKIFLSLPLTRIFPEVEL